MSSSLAYRSDIDGLRAIAVLPVILFHAGFDWFSGGYVGVDVFFVISGYLITSILLREIRAGEFSIVDFYERRARRILPALFVVCITALPFAWWLLPPAALEDFSQSLIATATFWSNILFWMEADYFAATAELKPLLHTWSLAIEEQFYLFFPLILLVLASCRLLIVNVVIIVFMVTSYGIMIWGLPSYPEATFYLLPTRAWELMVGALVALLHTYQKESQQQFTATTRSLTSILSLTGLTLIIGSIVLLEHDTPFPSHWTLLPVIGTALVIAFNRPQQWCFRILSQRTLVFVGLFSYSAYLWHQPIFAFTKHFVEGMPTTSAMFGLSVLALLLAYISWRYIEAPFRNKYRITRKPIFIFSGISIAILVTIGATGHINQGFLEIRSTPQLMHSLASTEPSPYRKACHTQGEDYLSPADSCTYGGDQLTWAVLGDSHAVEIAYVLSQQLKKEGIGLKHYSFSLCGPNYQANVASVKGCKEWTHEVINDLKRNADIKNVVLTFRLNYYLHGPHEDNYPNLPDEVSASTQREIFRGLINTANALLASNKHVILLLQSPEPPAHIDNLLFNHKMDLTLIKGVPISWWTQRNAFVQEHLKKLPEAVTVVDPTPAFCQSEWCYVTDAKGKAFYFDDDHLSLSGAKHLLNELIVR